MLPPLDQASVPASGVHLYIYYHAAGGDSAAIIKAVTQMQAQLRTKSNVCCGLMQRPIIAENQVTWMEIYSNVPSGFETALDHAIASTSLLEVIAGPRHAEYFTECSPCI